MKTFDKSFASHILVVRNLGIRKEIFMVPVLAASYVLSQAVYQYTLGTKPTNIKVYELTWDLAKEAKPNFQTIAHTYPGQLPENIYANNSKECKFLTDVVAIHVAELDIDSVLADGERKEFFIVVMKSPENPETSMSIYKSVARRTAMALAENCPSTEEVIDTRNYKSTIKQIFAAFPNKEYIEIPTQTYETFNKKIRPIIENA